MDRRVEERLKAIFEAPPYVPPLRAVPADGRGGLFEQLPSDAQNLVADCLRARSLHALSTTCMGRWSATRESGRVPGLRVSLWPHQIRSLAFLGAHDKVILADAPGLGKTVTVIASILRFNGLCAWEGNLDAQRIKDIVARQWASYDKSEQRVMINKNFLKRLREAKWATDGGASVGGGGGGGVQVVRATKSKVDGGCSSSASAFDEQHSNEAQFVARAAQTAQAEATMSYAKWDPYVWFSRPVDTKNTPGYVNDVPSAIDFKTIGKNAEEYGDLNCLFSDSRRVFANARAYHGKRQKFVVPPRPGAGSPWTWEECAVRAAGEAAESAAIVAAADRLDEVLSDAIEEMQVTMLRTALATRSGIGTPREVEAMRVRGLVGSGATLVVVPRPLLSHWISQLDLHVDSQFLPEHPFYFDDDAGRNNLERSSGLGQQGPWRDLPSAQYLAGRLIVLVTIERLSHEFGRASSLKMLHWKAVVVDEGHSRAKSTLTNVDNMLNDISADKRILMTGTPRNGENPAEWLTQTGNLLACLQHPLARTWTMSIVSPLVKNSGDAQTALKLLTNSLRSVLVCHDKATVKLAPPQHEVVLVRLSRAGRRAYNAVVAAAQLNLKLTAMAGGIPGAGWLESLLHPGNRKQAAAVVRNVLAACSGSGDHVVQITLQNRNETEALLRDQFQADQCVVDKIMSLVSGFGLVSDEKTSFKKRAAEALESSRLGGSVIGDPKRRAACGRKSGDDVYILCESCRGVELQNPAFTPCGHFICPECITPTMAHCPVPECGLPFPAVPKVVKDAAGNVKYDDDDRLVLSYEQREHCQDAFANMQAGAGVEWRHTARQDLSILIGSAYLQEQRRQQQAEGVGRFKVDEKYKPASNAPVAPAKVGLRELFGLSRTELGGSGKNGSSSRTQCSGSSSSTRSKADDLSWAPPNIKSLLRENAKARYVVTRMRNIMAEECAQEDTQKSGAGFSEEGHRPLKVIVYSEHQAVLRNLGDCLVKCFNGDFVAYHAGAYRNIELDKFTKGVVMEWYCPKCGYRNDKISRNCRRELLALQLVSPLTDNSNPDPAAVEIFVAREGSAALKSSFEVEASSVRGYVEGVSEFTEGQRVVVRRKDRDVACVVKAAGRHCNAKPETKSLVERSVECRVLLLSKDGSEGLDLSMVTHIFVVNTIPDAAQEKQLVSRAYRMGASGPVKVIQLPVAGTVEEIILRLRGKKRRASLSSLSSSSSSSSSSSFSSSSYSLSGAGDAAGEECVDDDFDRAVGSLPSDGDDALVDETELADALEAQAAACASSSMLGASLALGSAADKGKGKASEKVDRAQVRERRMALTRNFLLRNMRLLRGTFSDDSDGDEDLAMADGAVAINVDVHPGSRQPRPTSVEAHVTANLAARAWGGFGNREEATPSSLPSPPPPPRADPGRKRQRFAGDSDDE